MIFQQPNMFFEVTCPECGWRSAAHNAHSEPNSALECPFCRGVPVGRAERPWVYIAGPISLGDTHKHVHTALATWKYLWQEGLHPICPHWSSLQQMAFPISWEEWITFDLAVIRRCDAVLRLPGESRGADKETDEARRLSIPVFDRVDDLLKHLKGVS